MTELAKNHWPNINITLKSYTDYWKFSGAKEIILSVSYDNPIMVRDFIKQFNVTWHYTENEVSDFYTNKEYRSESAVCNLNQTEELFLISGIEWIHVYTWHD